MKKKLNIFVGSVLDKVTFGNIWIGPSKIQLGVGFWQLCRNREEGIRIWPDPQLLKYTKWFQTYCDNHSTHLPRKFSDILVRFTGLRLASATFLLFIVSGPLCEYSRPGPTRHTNTVSHPVQKRLAQAHKFDRHTTSSISVCCIQIWRQICRTLWIG